MFGFALDDQNHEWIEGRGVLGVGLRCEVGADAGLHALARTPAVLSYGELAQPTLPADKLIAKRVGYDTVGIPLAGSSLLHHAASRDLLVCFRPSAFGSRPSLRVPDLVPVARVDPLDPPDPLDRMEVTVSGQRGTRS